MKDTSSLQVDKDNWLVDDANHEIVLRSSSQCVPMIKYDEGIRKTKKGRECIQNIEKDLQAIFDKYFNKGLDRTQYQDVEMLTTATSSSAPNPPGIFATSSSAPPPNNTAPSSSASTALSTRPKPTNQTLPSILQSQSIQGSNAPPATVGNVPATIKRSQGIQGSNAPSSTAGSTTTATTAITNSSAPPLLQSAVSTSAAAGNSALRTNQTLPSILRNKSIQGSNAPPSTVGFGPASSAPTTSQIRLPRSTSTAANSSSLIGIGGKNVTGSIQATGNAATASTPSTLNNRVFLIPALLLITASKLTVDIFQFALFKSIILAALNVIVSSTIMGSRVRDHGRAMTIYFFSNTLICMFPVTSKVQTNNVPIEKVVPVLIFAAAALSFVFVLIEKVAHRKALLKKVAFRQKCDEIKGRKPPQPRATTSAASIKKANPSIGSLGTSAVSTGTLNYKAPESLTKGIPPDAMFTPDLSCNMQDDCAICWDALQNGDQCAILKCRHIFHKGCIQRAFSQKPECPKCRKSIGEPVGKCPSGTMTTTITPARCSGFQEDSIVIVYAIPSGKQKSYHCNPGIIHASKRTYAFLPNNLDGRTLLKRLKFAFLHGLTFTVGTSLTSGKDNQCTWASIHHKTSRSGSVLAHGFPDPDYFNNCNAELDALGVPRAHSLDENGKDV